MRIELWDCIRMFLMIMFLIGLVIGWNGGLIGLMLSLEMFLKLWIVDIMIVILWNWLSCGFLMIYWGDN